MRIIAGEFRGRKLLSPKSDVTRPITDRVKQSLFDILTPRIEGAKIYDCFAGTGSMGLEALSRGAAKVVFFERDRGAVKLLTANIEALKINDRADVIDTDIFRWFTNARGEHDVQISFLDPPYRFIRERPADLQNLASGMSREHLTPDGVLVFRHNVNDSLDLPALSHIDRREYGSMVIEFLSRRTT